MAPTLPVGCADGGCSRAIPGISMKCSSVSGAFCTFGEPWISMGSCWTSGAGPSAWCRSQAFLQAPVAWAAVQAAAYHHRRPAQLWRRQAGGPAGCPASHEQIPQQQSRKFSPTDAPSRAPDAEVQVRQPGAAIPVSACDDLRSLSAATPSNERDRISPRSREGVRDLATGNLRPPRNIRSPLLSDALVCLPTD